MQMEHPRAFSVASGSPRHPASGDRRLAAESQVVTFKDFVLTFYLPHIQGLRKDWEPDAAILLKYLIPMLGAKPLQDVRPEEMTLMYTVLRHSGMNASEYSRITSCLSELFDTAIQWGIVAENPCRLPQNTEVETLPAGTLSRVEQLIIWMRRHGTSYGRIGRQLGITRMSVGRLCRAERIPPQRFAQLTKLGIPAHLLPPAVEVKRGKKGKKL